MKFFTFAILILISVFFSGSNLAQAETISNFSVDYTVNKDGSVAVTESITYDFENAIKHGIFRLIEKKHPQPPTVWYKDRRVEIEVLSVKKDGVSEPYSLTDDSKKIEIKIGDPDKEITSVHTYEVSYILRGALSYGSSGAEFYWNVTGNEWPVTIQKAVARVQGENLEILQGKTSCYQGLMGDTAACTSTKSSEGQLIFTASNLLLGEGLTIATELNPQAVAILKIEPVPYLIFGFILATLWVFFFSYWAYRYRVQNRIHKPVIAQYEPYPNYLPMYTGVLYDGRLDPRDITAGIIYLAEQGFIKIKRTEKKVLLFISVTDYEITLLRPVADIPTAFLKALSGILFDASTIPPQTVLLSSLTKNQIENRVLIQSLRRSLSDDLKTSGITTNTLPSWSLRKTLVLFLFVVLFGPFFFVTNGVSLIIFVIISSLILGLISLIGRRTRKGYEILNHLEGFKLFLSVTDKERFDIHNAPEKSPDLFMKYLPYAVALGVEEKWAKVFEDITIPQPDWYDGGSVGAFSAAALTNDVSAFSNSFSASSGTSGSSGGGSAGGGGGGGGGGSW